jgi:pantoate--beta-alanine ligase
VTAVVRSRAELAAARAALPGTVGLVPTMGALHAGHAALIETARRSCGSVVVSVFVNPMQFDQGADLDRYPRPFDADLELCRRLGADLVWHPPVEQVYPDGRPMVWLTAGALADQLEGPNRPGHFDGMLTVVAKLFAAVRPERAFFGEKDYQQLVLVRRMVRDLGTDVEVVGVTTVRDPDGLALSSRNAFLSAPERLAARALSAALRAGEAVSGDADAVLAAARRVLDAEPGVELDYLALRDPDLGDPPPSGPARLLVAARVGQTRLIDNTALVLSAQAGRTG